MATSDHLINATRAGIALVPGVGGAILELIGDVTPSKYDRANQVAQDSLREQVSARFERMEMEYVRTDEFADLYKNCFFTVQRTQQQEKIIAAVNIVTNSLLKQDDPDRLTYAELDHFAHCLESLSLEAIHALKTAIGLQNPNNISGPLLAQTLGVEEALLTGLLRELESCDFVLLSFSSARYEGYDSYSVKLRPLAEKFRKYVLDAGNADTKT